MPKGKQQEVDDRVEMLYPDIPIVKLGPGQELEVQMHVEKGRGMDHTKWSPVGSSVGFLD